MIVERAVCSHCHKRVPEGCDGRTFKLTEHPGRVVCIGRDRDDVDVRNMRYLYTMGHGSRWWTPMEEEQ